MTLTIKSIFSSHPPIFLMTTTTAFTKSKSKRKTARQTHYRCITLSLLGLLYLTFNYGFSPSTKEEEAVDLLLHHSHSHTLCPVPLKHSRHIPTLILTADGKSSKAIHRTHWIAEGTINPLQSTPDMYLTLASSAFASHGPCPTHLVPSTRSFISKTWKSSDIMFGMTTNVHRVMENLPLMNHWAHSSYGSSHISSGQPHGDLRPIVLVLTDRLGQHELNVKRNLLSRAVDLNIHLNVQSRDAKKAVERSFILMEEMWSTAVNRELEDGIVTDWFALVDDDTFFPDFDSVIEMLSTHDPNRNVIIGALSEIKGQPQSVRQFAHGGAGIFLSRTLLTKINSPGTWQKCVARFGEDMNCDEMISLCSAYLMEGNFEATLAESRASAAHHIVFDSSLHQLDMKGDVDGWFNSGFLMTSLHHLGTRAIAVPSWHPSGAREYRDITVSIGRASKLIGGSNFGRRYILDEGKMMISLGYAVTLYRDPLTKEKLSKTEWTWEGSESTHAVRERDAESVVKRTFFLSEAMELHPGVILLKHIDVDFMRVDIVWDRRNELKPSVPARGSLLSWRPLS